MEGSYGYFNEDESSGIINAGLVPFTKAEAAAVVLKDAKAMSLDDIEILLQIIYLYHHKETGGEEIQPKKRKRRTVVVNDQRTELETLMDAVIAEGSEYAEKLFQNHYSDPTRNCVQTNKGTKQAWKVKANKCLLSNNHRNPNGSFNLRSLPCCKILLKPLEGEEEIDGRKRQAGNRASNYCGCYHKQGMVLPVPVTAPWYHSGRCQAYHVAIQRLEHQDENPDLFILDAAPIADSMNLFDIGKEGHRYESYTFEDVISENLVDDHYIEMSDVGDVNGQDKEDQQLVFEQVFDK